MIGLGKWQLDVSVPMLKVQPILTISDNNGKYEFTVDASGFGITPAINLVNTVEEGNTLKVRAQVPMLNLCDVEGKISFEGVHCTGEVNVPMIGKITIRGVRVG